MLRVNAQCLRQFSGPEVILLSVAASFASASTDPIHWLQGPYQYGFGVVFLIRDT